VGAAQQVGSQAGASQQVGSQAGAQQVGSQQLDWQQPPRLNRPAWASLANNEAAPATSNKANRIFAFMGVLKKETGCLLRRHTPSPFQRLGDQILIGSNRQSLRMALTGQIGFMICRFPAWRGSCHGERKVRP
jgi:hypothetical protein